MADPVKKTTTKSVAKSADKEPKKVVSSSTKKGATTSKSVKAPKEPGKAKTEPVAAEKVAAKPAKKVTTAKAAAPKAEKVITARATKAKEETSPLMPKPKVSPQDRYHLIATTAYFLFTQRGGQHGRDIDDWVAAETLITARLG